ncbi:AMP-binding protein, partial [Rhizobium johnstonii]
MRTHLHHLLAERADTHPDDPAVTYRDDTLTYGEAWRQAQRVAAQLRGLGLERGDRVAVYLEKRLETIASIFGISA